MCHPSCNIPLPSGSDHRKRFGEHQLPSKVAADRGGGGVTKKCVCSTTTHPGSFRCRYHRSGYKWGRAIKSVVWYILGFENFLYLYVISRLDCSTIWSLTPLVMQNDMIRNSLKLQRPCLFFHGWTKIMKLFSVEKDMVPDSGRSLSWWLQKYILLNIIFSTVTN